MFAVFSFLLEHLLGAAKDLLADHVGDELAAGLLLRRIVQGLLLADDRLSRLLNLRLNCLFLAFDQGVQYPPFGIATQLNVRAATRHVRRDCHCARRTGLRDNLCFLFVETGVEHLMRHAFSFGDEAFQQIRLRVHAGDLIGIFLLVQVRGPGAQFFSRNFQDLQVRQHARKLLRLFNRSRADQHRLTAQMRVGDRLNNGDILFIRRPIDLIIVVDARDFDVGRNVHNLKPVDRGKFLRLSHRRTGHAGQLVV